MKKIILAVILTLCLLGSSCITINPAPAPAPASAPTPEPQPIDIEAFISTPDWQPSYTIADLAQAKAELANFFEESYYAERTYVAEKYKPHDLATLKQALSDMNQLPWKYKAGYFDCSEMSALVQLYLKVAGFDAVIVLGRDPEVQGAGHAWNTIFLQSGAVPIEPTSLSIPKATGNIYGQPPNQVVMNYGDYLRSGWVLRDIYEAWVWRPHEFDWWNSYALSMDELFGVPPTPVPAPTPAPAPKPTPAPIPAPVPTPTRLTTSVEILAGKFYPARIEVKVGTIVTWTNKSMVGYCLEGEGGINSPLLDKYDTYSFTFNQAGTFSYHARFRSTALGGEGEVAITGGQVVVLP